MAPSRTSLYFASFIFPSILIIFPIPADEKLLKILHYHVSLWGSCSQVVRRVGLVLDIAFSLMANNLNCPRAIGNFKVVNLEDKTSAENAGA